MLRVALDRFPVHVHIAAPRSDVAISQMQDSRSKRDCERPQAARPPRTSCLRSMKPFCSSVSVGIYLFSSKATDHSNWPRSSERLVRVPRTTIAARHVTNRTSADALVLNLLFSTSPTLIHLPARLLLPHRCDDSLVLILRRPAASEQAILIRRHRIHRRTFYIYNRRRVFVWSAEHNK